MSSVDAPCGELVFGGDMRLRKAKEEIGSALNYRCRFIQGRDDDSIIADREYNVQEIAKASMGNAAVLDIIASPNLISCTLFPAGSDKLIRADLVTLARKQENSMNNTFICSELSQQIITALGEGTMGFTENKNRQLKQIETISSFQRQEVTGQIHCVQRTATFLVPSQQDPAAFKMWQMTKGRPIDVRFFHVVYSKIT